MIEQGFTTLISTGIASQFPNLTGGFPTQLPPNFISTANPWSWSWRSILSTPMYFLQGQDALTTWEVQLDCYGNSMAQAVQVARAIDGVLRGGYSGTLSDPDNTVVSMIKRLPGMVDGFSDLNRSYVRSLEYEVIYYQS
jgi:hypothetical protein